MSPTTFYKLAELGFQGRKIRRPEDQTFDECETFILMLAWDGTQVNDFGHLDKVKVPAYTAFFHKWFAFAPYAPGSVQTADGPD